MERVGLRDEADASGAPILQTHLSPPTRLIPPYPALSALLWCLTLGLTSLHTMPMPSGMKLPVFSLGDDIYTWQDVVAHARATGDWASLEQAAREGAACEALADSGEIDEPDADIEHAAEEFRYERDLVTAAEMEEWLAEHGLTAADWMGAMRRLVLRQQWAADLEAIVSEQDPDDESVQEALEADLRSSGMDRTLSQRFAADVAAAAAWHGANSQGGAPPGRDLAGVLEGARSYRASVVTDDAIEREITAAHLDWIRVECRALAFEDEAEAREGVFCLREDGIELDELAADAHVETEDVDFYVGDIAPDRRAPFLSAQVGEVIGPVALQGAHAIYQVTGKVMPSVDDEALIRRARDAIVGRAIATEVANRIRWHA